MNVNSMLPPRGHDPERLETDARTLRKIVESEGAPTRKKGLRRIGLPLAVTVAVAGAGGVAAAAILNLGHIEHDGPKSFPVSTNLQMTVTPDHGSVGSTVHVTVTGCYDPTHNDHYVSFWSDSATADGAMQHEHDVTVTTSNGSTFTGTFKVPADATRHAEFVVQCGGSQRRALFRPTNPLTARPCSATDVRATLASYGGAATGHFIVPLTFTNTSPSTCWLEGTPQHVRLAETNGRYFAAARDGFVDQSSSIPMAPHGTTMVLVETTEECAARPGGGPAVNASGHLQILIGSQWVNAVGGIRQWDVGCGLGYGNYSQR